MSTFVLLEQERWFEKEIDFVESFITPGMVVVDIGANVGVYSLLCALKAESTGAVFAYEPNPDIARLLKHSAAINGFTNLITCGLAVSNEVGQTVLSIAASSELGAIDPTGKGISVKLTSLDNEMLCRAWSKVDFLKIDAEGVEEKIIDGAQKFLAQFAPVIMIEIAQPEGLELGATKKLEQAGYQIFRQLGRAPVLIPFDWSTVDIYELNLFAVPPEKIASMQSARHLVKKIHSWKETGNDLVFARGYWREQKYVRELSAKCSIFRNQDYANALTAYACWADEKRNLVSRVGALQYALDTLRRVCQQEPSLPRLVSLSRVAMEFGFRYEAFQATVSALDLILQSSQAPIDEIFCAPSLQSERVSPRGGMQEWLTTSLREQNAILSRHSEYIGRGENNRISMFRTVEKMRFSSLRTTRTRVLLEAYAGMHPQIPASLNVSSHSNLNARLWSNNLMGLLDT